MKSLIFCVCLSVYALTGHTAPEQIPVSDFFNHAKFTDLKISPSGRYLAATVPIKTETRLAVIDLKNMAFKQVLGFGKNQHVTGFFWATDERLLMLTAIKLGWLDQPSSRGDLWAVDVNGKNKELLIELSGFQITSLLDDDPDHILVTKFNASNYPDIYKVNIHQKLEDNFRRRIMRSPLRNGNYLADHDGVIRMVTGSNAEGQITVIYREDANDEWKEIGQYDPTQGSVTPIRFHQDNRRVYVRTSIGAPTSGLGLLDPDTGETELVFRDELVDTGGLLLAADRKTVLGVTYLPDYPKTHWVEPSHPTAKILKGLGQAFPEERVTITSFTQNGDKGVALVVSDRNPGEFFLFDTKTNKLSALVKRMPWIKPNDMSRREPFSMKARDGLTMHGYLTRPQSQKDKALPMIVLPHGGPHGVRDSWYFDADAAFFASRGYAVLQLNYRGSGGYGREFLYSGYRKWGREMQDDLTDATLWAVEQGIADEGRVCIYGASYGGYASLMGVVKEPDLYDCAVGYVGVYDLPLMFERGDIKGTEDGKAFMRAAIGTDEADLIARSPARHVDKIKVPLLLVHGKKDIRAHYKHYTVLTKALKKAGVPFDSLVKPKEAHGFFDEKNREELYNMMWQFFDRNIGPGADNRQAAN